ncbi:ATP-binding protein [Sessilibacter corallicola]|uniref:ATP-binding protein n=1 Tax=Sessilibacter corallicola TaxID=2904075 RepID=UPI001E622F91|nr:ATP-binding protein [Sessilibacter corallicola]MCE2028415.1 ATP-binding protein [Sessilibacter corallicola]
MNTVKPIRNYIKQIAFITFAIIASGLIFHSYLIKKTIADNHNAVIAYEQSLISVIDKYKYLPEIIAADPLTVQLLTQKSTSYFNASDKLAFIKLTSGVDVAYVMDEQGNVVATSNYANKQQSFLGNNYHFRPYFSETIKHGTQQYYYAIGATTFIPGLFISAPIYSADNQRIGVAVVKLSLSKWESDWELPQANVAVVNSDNIVILSSNDHWRYKTFGTITEPSKQKVAYEQQFPGQKPQELMEKSFYLPTVFDSAQLAGFIDGDLYLISDFDLRDVHWKVLYITPHNNIKNQTLLFLVVVSLLAMMTSIIVHNRREIQAAQEHQRELKQRRNEELQSIIDNIHIGVLSMDSHGNLVSLNKHAQYLLFGEEKSFEQINITDLLPIDFANIDNLLLNEISVAAYHETETLSRTQKQIPVMFAVCQVDTLDNGKLLMTLINIERRKKAENDLKSVNLNLERIISDRTERLQKVQKRLIQKNKTVALGNMAATIVHELSQPLTAMKSLIGVINAKFGNEDWNTLPTTIGRLNPIADNMSSILSLLKNFSYQDKNTHDINSISQLLESTLKNTQELLSDNQVDVLLTNDEFLALVSINGLKFDIVINNLVRNSVDALANKADKRIWIDTRVDVQKHLVQITLEDNAGGIPEEIKVNLFNPYFTTKEVGKGLGLGLAITYEIIQEYRGHITVTNTEQGAKFEIQLPLMNPSL